MSSQNAKNLFLTLIVVYDLRRISNCQATSQITHVKAKKSNICWREDPPMGGGNPLPKEVFFGPQPQKEDPFGGVTSPPWGVLFITKLAFLELNMRNLGRSLTIWNSSQIVYNY